MGLRFKRLICRIFGHKLIVGRNYWICGRCNYFKPRNGGIVPTDRVTPGAPPRLAPRLQPLELPPTLGRRVRDENGRFVKTKAPIDEFNVAFQKAKAAGFPEPDTILIPDKSKFKSRSLTTAVRDDGGVAVQRDGQTGCGTCPSCGVVPCQCLDTPYK